MPGYWYSSKPDYAWVGEMLHVWGPRRVEIIFYDNGGSQLSSIGCRMAAIVIKGYIVFMPDTCQPVAPLSQPICRNNSLNLDEYRQPYVIHTVVISGELSYRLFIPDWFQASGWVTDWGNVCKFPVWLATSWPNRTCKGLGPFEPHPQSLKGSEYNK